MHSRITTLFAYLVVAVTPMLAQNLGAIAGIVKDPSGSVIPGVTVEASSPALIEGKARGAMRLANR